MSVLENKQLYIFDIDRTLITSRNLNGDLIWLKNMYRPFKKINDHIVEDAKGSVSTLHKGTREVLLYLTKQKKDIGFLSAGSLPNVHYDLQPSVLIMKMFNIYSFFNSHKLLEYKTLKKEEHLKDFGECVFFDDDEKYIIPAYKLDNVTVVDRKSFTDWRQLL
tara:strand:- start:5408 stop:5896 length:489 start_codon:yes stop_codon:yes gene_type:complete